MFLKNWQKHCTIYLQLSRFFQYIGGVYMAPTLCFMLLDEAAIFRETTECKKKFYIPEWVKDKQVHRGAPLLKISIGL